VILVALDFSPHSDVALRRAIHVARILGDEVALLHVIDEREPSPRDVARDVAKEALARMASRADPDGRVIRVKDVIEGRPAHVILSVAQAVQARTIVVGKRGEGVHQGLGSVAERVVRGATCDVLVVRKGGTETLRSDGQED
jgi:universal stress protein A